MDVKELLEQVKSSSVEIEDTQVRLKGLPYEDSRYVKLDHHRKLRSGFGKTVFRRGEPDAYLLKVCKKFYERDGGVLGARASKNQTKLARAAVPGVVYDPISRTPRVEKPGRERRGYVAVCTGGTADIPVAKETAQTAEYFGRSADRIFDMGVAGIHRLLVQRECLGRASRVVAVAGVEGALGTVIAGLVEYPVATVPTSVGYGADFHGLSALLIMFNSCANGISMVNIDNGYGASYLTA